MLKSNMRVSEAVNKMLNLADLSLIYPKIFRKCIAFRHGNAESLFYFVNPALY
ncbi:hypothetical protein L585_11945 [Pantoea ananatis BRT175]|nr:hypothetical protein L585_14010 [Pantoea ananatis BRT175]ERM13357.1 hypothetical protein L585_13935 [Pantoea ananatis BRT175]ERM13469.1 hypothetical protein L585_13165 [Pantoea ananatis BRT175]ERM13896.1 hypothetical protein L585_11945 [Pantoea ananatis BRT175]